MISRAQLLFSGSLAEVEHSCLNHSWGPHAPATASSRSSLCELGLVLLPFVDGNHICKNECKKQELRMIDLNRA